MTEWSEQWKVGRYELDLVSERPPQDTHEVVLKQEAEQKIEETQAKARELNGKLVDALDGRRDAEQRAEEADAERDQALKQGAAEERERLRGVLEKKRDELNEGVRRRPGSQAARDFAAEARAFGWTVNHLSAIDQGEGP